MTDFYSDLPQGQDRWAAGALMSGPCPSCGGILLKTDLTAGEVFLHRCENCSAEMLWPLPSPTKLDTYYEAETCFSAHGEALAQQWLADPTAWRADTEYFDRDIRRLGIAPGAKLVDFGCSFGLTVLEWARLGYDAWGIEPSRAANAFLTKHGGNGHRGSIESLPGGPVDVFFSSHTLEHVPNPYETLSQMFAAMRPGGLLVVAVPNWGGLVAQSKAAGWKWFCPDHLHYFRPHTFKAAIEHAGFQVLEWCTTAHEHEVTESFDVMGVAADQRTPEARAAARKMIQAANIGEAIIVKARRP